MKTLILGMGNPILADDGAGIWAARELQDRVNQEEVTVMETGIAGLNLLELLTGFDKAILIDAIQTREGKIGRVYRLKPEAFNDTRHAINPHGIDLSTALELGSRLGVPLPQEIILFAIEAADVVTFSENCTPEVAQAISVATDMVMQELNGDNHA